MTTQIRLQEEAKEVLGQVMENKETVHREEVGMLTQVYLSSQFLSCRHILQLMIYWNGSNFFFNYRKLRS